MTRRAVQQLALPGLATGERDRCMADPDGIAGGPASRHRAKGARRPARTIWRQNPREQGLIGLTDAIGWFGANGYQVSLPLVDAQPYDLIVDDGVRLQRVQVKTTTYRSPYGIFIVTLSTGGGNQSFHTVKPFDPTMTELLYVLTDDCCRYLVPTDRVASRRTLSLGARMRPYLVS